jgi:hypothetical protein
MDPMHTYAAVAVGDLRISDQGESLFIEQGSKLHERDVDWILSVVSNPMTQACHVPISCKKLLVNKGGNRLYSPPVFVR